MGVSRRPYRPRKEAGHDAVRRVDDPRSPSALRRPVAAGPDGRFQPRLARPSPGDRFGQLVVTAHVETPSGGLKAILVICDCGSGPYEVNISNLRNGRSTRCNTCAKRASGSTTKQWFGYAGVVPDDSHRRRLCNRISACYNRCHNPKDAGYPNYGGRGIRVYEPWRADRAAFLRYLVSLEGWDDPALELDREDVDKGYEPGNLRFVSHARNQANRRKIGVLQTRIAELEARLRHCSCGAA